MQVNIFHHDWDKTESSDRFGPVYGYNDRLDSKLESAKSGE